ncbi:tRNA (adenosine(37)-N6)-threonylcarbamoyltransferase complex ATPase subunit type 1 TsaE [Halomonas denitrificans]|nr:tRNA (adenosine(37)-N6)-threonylcarbamoyltransferase complex ATPase subunit type 1 TsaE [Halomonas denitrificans]
MLALGETLATRLAPGVQVWLSGDLGAGKTTLVRGVLRGLGYQGRVKSPTYGLVESYDLTDVTVHHLDLYRLTDPEELDFLGLDDLIGADSLLLVEWPERGRGMLREADVRISIEPADATDISAGRNVTVEGLGNEGKGIRD